MDRFSKHKSNTCEKNLYLFDYQQTIDVAHKLSGSKCYMNKFLFQSAFH